MTDLPQHGRLLVLIIAILVDAILESLAVLFGRGVPDNFEDPRSLRMYQFPNDVFIQLLSFSLLSFEVDGCLY